MSEQLEVMFDDLNEAAQKKVLEFYNIEKPADSNFDTVPIAVLETEEEDDEEGT